jgi:hypothetical protein
MIHRPLEPHRSPARGRVRPIGACRDGRRTRRSSQGEPCSRFSGRFGSKVASSGKHGPTLSKVWAHAGRGGVHQRQKSPRRGGPPGACRRSAEKSIGDGNIRVPGTARRVKPAESRWSACLSAQEQPRRSFHSFSVAWGPRPDLPKTQGRDGEAGRPRQTGRPRPRATDVRADRLTGSDRSPPLNRRRSGGILRA